VNSNGRIAAPATALRAGSTAGVNIYRGPGLFGRRWLEGWPLASANLVPIRTEGGDSRMLASVVIAEVWQGLSAGGLLVARRPATFDELVRLGCSLHVSGGAGVESAQRATARLLGGDVAAALWRRVRFAAIVDGPSKSPCGAVLRVADAGRGSFH
jgi:hypothetical protein